MRNKIIKSVVIVGCTLSIPIVFATSFATKNKNTHRNFIFNGREFSSMDNALKYLFQKQIAKSSEVMVYGDLYKSYSNYEKGILNKALLPDYDPDKTLFAYRNAGGGLTDNYSEAKKSYFNKGRIVPMFEDGFGGIFSTELAAQDSMDQKKIMSSFGVFKPYVFLNGEKQPLIVNKSINIMNKNDLDFYKENITKNFYNILNDNIENPNKRKFEYKIKIKTPVKKKISFDSIDVKNLIDWAKTMDYSLGNLDIQYSSSSKEFKCDYSSKNILKTKIKADKKYLGTSYKYDDKDHWKYFKGTKVTIKDYGERFGWEDMLEKFQNKSLTNKDIIKIMNGGDGGWIENTSKIKESDLFSIKQTLEIERNNKIDKLKKIIENKIDDYKTIKNKKGDFIYQNIKQELKQATTKILDKLKVNSNVSNQIVKFPHIEVQRDWHHDWKVVKNFITHNVEIKEQEISWNLNSKLESKTRLDKSINFNNDLVSNIVNGLSKDGKIIENKSVEFTIELPVKKSLYGKNKEDIPIFYGKLKMDSNMKFNLLKENKNQLFYKNQFYIGKESEEQLFYRNFYNDIKNQTSHNKNTLPIWKKYFDASSNERNGKFKANFKLAIPDSKLGKGLNMEDNFKLYLSMLSNSYEKFQNFKKLLHELEMQLINPQNIIIFGENKKDSNFLKNAKYIANNVGDINPALKDPKTEGMFASEMLKWSEVISNSSKTSIPTRTLVVYDVNGRNVNIGQYKHDNEILMEFNSRLIQEPKRDFQHIFYERKNSEGQNTKELVSSSINSIYKLQIDGQMPVFFETYKSLYEYAYQFIKNNLIYI